MMRFLTPFCALALAFIAPVTLAQTGDPQAGQNKVQLCVACHGQTGNAISPLFANIAGQGAKYLLKQMQDIQSGARSVPEMTGMLSGFDDQDLADIAAFFARQPVQITGAAQITNEAFGLDAADMLDLGRSIYMNGNMETGVAACSGCHSPTGQGNFPAGYPRLGGQHREYISRQLINFRGNLRTNDGDTEIMRGVARRMTDLEIQAVSNYIAGLN